MIPFGEWLPDQSDLGSVGTTVAKNVIPAARGYRPFLGLANLSAATDSHLRGFLGLLIVVAQCIYLLVTLQSY